MIYRVTFAASTYAVPFEMMIPAVPAPGLSGHLDMVSGALMMPDLAALYRRLPADYRQSMRRAPFGTAIWFDHWHPKAPGWLTFRDRRGIPFNGAYFTPLPAASSAIN